MQVRRSKWQTLRVKLVVVVLCALIPIAMLLGVLWTDARRRDRDHTLASLAQTAQACGVVTDDVFDEAITLARAIAADHAVRTLDQAGFTTWLRTMKDLSPNYLNIVVIDQQGVIRGWADPTPVPSPAPRVDALGFFSRVMKSGQPTVMGPLDQQAAAILGTGVAAPILADDGSTVGLVAVTFNLNLVGDRLTSLQLFPGQALALLDPDGRLATLVGVGGISSADLTWEQRDRSGRPEVQAALRGEVAMSATYRATPTSQERLAVFVRTPRYGWAIGVTWPVDEALATTRQAEWRELMIFAAIVFSLAVGAALATNSLIEPLRRLSQHAVRLGQGEFEPITSIRSRDEIGELATTFNIMGEWLQQTLGEVRGERARLMTILEQLPVGVVMADARSGDVTVMNEQGERLWWRPAGRREAVDQSILVRAFHLDGSPYESAEGPLGRSLRDGEEIRGEEIMLRRDDGTTRIITINAAPIRDGDGAIVAAVAALDDITDRRRGEADSARLVAIVESSDDAILSKTLDGIITSWNSGAERIYGYTASEMIGQSIGVLIPADRPHELATVLDRVRRDEPVGSFETIRIAKDGRRLDVSVTISPIRSSAGGVVGASMIARDISDARAHQIQLAQTEKLRALGQMAGGIAHDLNQSLSLVAGYSDLVETAVSKPTLDRAELREMAQIMGRAAHDGGETVTRLLLFARGETNEQKQVLDVSVVLHEVAQLTAPRWRDTARAEGRPVDLRVESQPDMMVLGSMASLREALTNLVFNALDAMPHGGTIALRTHRSGDQVVIDVADSGVGMAPEVQAHVFEPFFTTKGEHGTGLGLAVVFGIVQRHHGQIDVSSSPGQGTTIQLRFPSVQAMAGDVRTDTREPSSRSLRILVVDDESQLAQLLSSMLRGDGHRPSMTLSGRDALEQLAAEPFDLVITDLSMGDGMNGWELATAIGQMFPGTPIVLATGWGAMIDEDEAQSRGMRAVVAKPYRRASIRAAIEQALQ